MMPNDDRSTKPGHTPKCGVLRLVAAGLLLVSGVTHVVQLPVYGAEHSVIGATIFGGIYFAVGLSLLGTSRTALVLGAIFPSVGGVLGVYRFLHLHPNPFSVFHVAIDLVVVPACVFLLLRAGRAET